MRFIIDVLALSWVALTLTPQEARRARTPWREKIAR